MSRRFLLSLLCLFCLIPPAGTLAAFGGSGETPAAAAKKKTPAASASASKTAASRTRLSTKSSSLHKSSLSSKISSRKTPRASLAHPLHRPAPSARSIQLVSAFHASEQLRPMAQQLASTRAAAAYSGVLEYARAHPGEPAAAAYLALAHSYSLDHRYPEALADFSLAKRAGDALDDYADYLGAQAAIQAGRGTEAYPLLDRFADRHPDSIFIPTAPVALANAHLQQNDARGAVAVIEPVVGTPQASAVDFQFALARAYQLSGETAQSTPIFHNIYTTQPLSYEAGQTATQLAAVGALHSRPRRRKTHADALFNAKHYAEAGDEYAAISKSNPQLGSADRDALTIYAAVCQFRVKHLSRFTVEHLPETSDDTAAAKQYMLAELSRDEHDSDPRTTPSSLQMVEKYPTSRWLEEALYSGGNMYLLQHDATQAIYHYSTLVRLFPASTYAPSAHWRAAWMNYRARNYSEAARLMDEQIQRYPGGAEIPSAIYWRGRIYEDEEHNFPQAANYYRRVSDIYPDYYYAMLARQRLAVLGAQSAVAPAPALADAQKGPTPDLTTDLPENDTHLIKARLLANAALNEYIAPEIHAADGSTQWGALAQGEIYTSYGEYSRALQAMKQSKISFFNQPMADVPTAYWHLLLSAALLDRAPSPTPAPTASIPISSPRSSARSPSSTLAPSAAPTPTA